MNNKHSINRSVLLNCIHIYLINLTDGKRIIDRKKLFGELGMGLRIPKEYRNKVINELEESGVLVKDNRDSFRIRKKVYF